MEAKELTKAQAQNYLSEYNSIRGVCYQIDTRLGSGGFSAVFRLKKLLPPVAVKISELKPCMRRHCEERKAGIDDRLCCHEVKIMQRVGDHPNIVRLIDYEPIEIWADPEPNVTIDAERVNLIFMQEYVDLNRWASQRKYLTEEELRRIAIDICKALECCAEKSVFHCDVKTANIFVAPDGKKTTFLLGDFGSAVIVNPHNPRPDLFSYTPGYLAPEIADLMGGRAKDASYDDAVVRAAGKRPEYIDYDPKLMNADVFSLGVSLYYMLSMNLPEAPFKFGKEERKLLKVSREFEEIIRKAVRYDPHERYASARDMRMDLERLVASPETVVFEFSQFYQAKEYLLSGKLDKAEKIARIGSDAGEPRCKLLLAYIHCIRASREIGDCTEQEYRDHMLPVMEELAEIYSRYGLPMAAFLHGNICLLAGYQSKFVRIMELAAARDCIPALFMWGKILNEREDQYPGRQAEGRACVYRAAEAEFQPALRYVKKYCKKMRSEYSDMIATLIEPVDINHAPEIFEAIVAYL